VTGGRDAVLRSVRASLAAARLPAAEPPAPAPPAAAVPGPDELVAVFSRELAGVGGTVHGPLEPRAAAEAALDLARGSGARSLIAWSADQLPLPGVLDAVAGAGLGLCDADLPTDPGARREKLSVLGEAGVGLTGAEAGLADTGSLVLRSGPGRPRLAWLLPPVHVALLPVASLLPDMAAFFARHAGAAGDAANLVFVTGPSRTADIELILTRGVHGPRHLHVVLIA
jgi:L-lactate dehydrogenase complex protein LldG